MDVLDEAIGGTGAVAYVMFASSQDANMRYLSRFVVNDPIVYIRCRGERGLLIVPQMEYHRAVQESACRVITRGDAGFFTILKEEKDVWKVYARMIADQTGGDILVPAKFPFALAQELQNFGTVSVDKGSVEATRAIKTSRELSLIRAAQQATEAAMDLAITLIRRTRPRRGVLHRDGTPLTSDDVRRVMHRFLLDRGYRAVDTIVSCGAETAMPHRQGDGPLLEGEPIVIDIFPRDERSGYYADMTRTVVYGEPSREIAEMYEAVREAQKIGKEMIIPGILGKDVHQAVVDYFTERGFATNTEGFIHSLGHGIGLDVHEKPSLSPSGEELLPGNTVTVEPGLYYTDIGGVRLEDLGVITKNGFDSFTNYTTEIRL